MDNSFHCIMLYWIFCPSSTNIKLQTFSNGAETTALQERSQVLRSVCRKSTRRIFHREQVFLKNSHFPSNFKRPVKNKLKKKIKNCTVLHISLLQLVKNFFETVLPGWRTGVTLSCCCHSTSLSLLGRGIPPERETGHGKRPCPEFSDGAEPPFNWD